MKCDYLIVGSGLTGSVIARLLKDAGYDVLVVERRSHIAGNLYDYCHPCGIRLHRYGPHYFRTDSKRIWDFVKRFDIFFEFEARLKTNIDGKLENWPISASYIHANIASDWKPAFSGTPSNFEEASLSMMPDLIYSKFIKGYTEKQWGILASELSSTLAGRFEVEENDDHRLKKSKYQGLPINGYTTFIRNMLEDIPVILNLDYIHHRNVFKAKHKTIFTGPIDEFFNFKMGKLKYRGQKRKIIYYPEIDDFQCCEQVNYPDKNIPYVRIIEWKKLMEKKYSSRINGTVVTMETPYTPDNPNDYEYPFPSKSEKIKYQKYNEIASIQKDMLFVGRLAEYKYIDMDKAIENAFKVTEKLL